MRSIRRLTLLFLLALAVLSRPANAQLTDQLFGIHNPLSGVFAFCSLDLSTMAITEIEVLPMGLISGTASATVDNEEGLYLFCTGATLFTLDPTGLLPTTSVALPLVGTARFNHIEFDPCTHSLYGFVNDPPDSIVFARYDITNNTFQTLLDMPSNMSFAMGAGSYVDPINRVYGFENVNSIMGIDIDSGALLYNTPMIDPPGESFGHLSYDCSTGQILGTSFGSTVEGGDGKWVSVVDPLTGVVTHLSSAHTPNALYKPALTGSCVDQVTGMFYWGGVNGAWVGANTSTGSIVLDEVSVPETPIFCINHISGCACLTADVEDVAGSHQYPHPMPAESAVVLPGVRGPLLWMDASGREVRVPVNFTTDGAIADVHALPAGIYMVRSISGVHRVLVE